MAFSYTNLTATGISDGSTIQANHILYINNNVNDIGGWFLNGLTGKLKLFASTTNEASLFFPSGSAPTSLAEGDMWREGDTLKLRVSNSQTKTLAFTDSAFTTLSLTTLTTSGETTANSLVVTTTSALNGATTVTATANPAFTVRDTDGTVHFQVNNVANEVKVLNATFSVGSGFNVSTAGDATANNLTLTNGTVTGNISVSGTLNATGAISRGGTAYLSPGTLHTTGFTVNLGNGVNVISSGVQLPIVIMPYACTITACRIASPQDSGNITFAVQKKNATTGTAWTTITNNLSLTASTANVASPTVSAASGQSLALSAGDVLRFNVGSISTLTSVAIQITVLRT